MDSSVTRLEALALLQTLNADLLSHPSATLTIERWCRQHQLAADPRIVAHLVRGVDKLPTAEQRQRLHVGPEEPVRYRRVELACGNRVLSVADNWYVPSRLTPEMNRLLDTTDTPFGKAVAALGFRRETLSATLLWSPLPDGWDMRPTISSAHAGPLAIPDQLLRHEALLFTRESVPICEVTETYTSAMLDFPQPKL
jgi:hypothetical protein